MPSSKHIIPGLVFLMNNEEQINLIGMKICLGGRNYILKDRIK